MAENDWAPLEPEECDCCGRATPGWWEKRNDHIADSLGHVSSARIARGYGMSETRVREIVVEVLGKRAYIDAIMESEDWAVSPGEVERGKNESGRVQ